MAHPIECPTRGLSPGTAESDRAETSSSPALAPELDFWLLWQLVDSAFPSGGYVHSNGLETAWRNGGVRSNQQVVAFAETLLSQLGRSALPFVRSAHAEPERLEEWDGLCDAFTTNHVANRASRAQGRAFLSSVRRIFAPSLPDRGALRCEHGHFSPVFGAVTRALGLGIESATRLFLFQHVRGLLSAAVRLNLIGTLEAQRMQFQLRRRAEEVRQAALGLDVEDIAQTAPILDVWQGTHDRLYSRLFQS